MVIRYFSIINIILLTAGIYLGVSAFYAAVTARLDPGTIASSPAPPRPASNTTDIVFLTTPWGAAEQAIASAGDLTGKIVVDCTNPIGADGLLVGTTTSAGELVAGWRPVKKLE